MLMEDDIAAFQGDYNVTFSTWNCRVGYIQIQPENYATMLEVMERFYTASIPFSLDFYEISKRGYLTVKTDDIKRLIRGE